MRRNRIRIIGGKWRRRKIEIASHNIRPTPDRVRETLFGWLQPHLSGVRVLDLFAGSGVLGFEALSRGASHVTLVDCDSTAIMAIRRTANLLSATESEFEIVHADALDWLRSKSSERWDIVFVDPPYDKHLVREAALSLLVSRLAPTGIVYLEVASQLPAVPEDFEVLKRMTAASVEALLVVVRSDATPGSWL